MHIVHRISLSTTKEDQEELSAFGVDAGEGFVTFEVTESHPKWSALALWIERRKPVDMVSTRFLPEELHAASWLEMVPSWHHGYPQPEDEFGYLRITYDLSQFCQECRIGAVQTAPFRMKHEPKWGRNAILQLNWVFDEFFVQPFIWKAIFEPFGIASREVLDAKTEQPLRTVVQIVISEHLEAVLDPEPKQSCPVCHRPKYEPHVRGPFPRLRSIPMAHAAKTVQYFGSGGQAYQSVLVSGELFRSISEHQARGVSFQPAESSLKHD